MLYTKKKEQLSMGIDIPWEEGMTEEILKWSPHFS